MAQLRTYTRKQIAEKFDLKESSVRSWLMREGIERIPNTVDDEGRAVYMADVVDKARAEMTGSGYWQEARVRKQISEALGKDTKALRQEK